MYKHQRQKYRCLWGSLELGSCMCPTHRHNSHVAIDLEFLRAIRSFLGQTAVSWGKYHTFLGQVPQFLRAKWRLRDNVSRVCKQNLAKSVILRVLLINHWSIRLQIHIVSHLVIQLIRLELLLFHNLVTTTASHANISTFYAIWLFSMGFSHFDVNDIPKS